VTQLILPGQGHGSRGVPLAVLVQGLCSGASLALLAAGLILVFRVNSAINFSAIALGALGAELTLQLVTYTSVPFLAALALGLVVSAATGAVAELVLVRRFAQSPPLFITMATILLAFTVTRALVGQLVKLSFLPPLLSRPPLTVLDLDRIRAKLPFPGLSWHVNGSSIPFTFPDLFSLEVGVVGLIVVVGFLRATRIGVAVGAASENPQRAATLGISVGVLATAAWAVTGLLSGLAVTAQSLSVDPGAPFNSSFDGLLVPLAAAVVARFRSIPIAVGVTLLITVLTSSVDYALADGQTINQTGIVAVIAIGLALSRKESYRLAGGASDFRATGEPRPIPRELASLGVVRGARYGSIGVALVALVAIPFVVPISVTVVSQSIALYGIQALSLVVLTGWMGQVSLGQTAFAAIGAVVTGDLAQHAGVPFLLSVTLGTLVAALIAVGLGVPALRVRGLGLAALTFALSAAIVSLLFDRNIWGTVQPSSVRRPKIGFLDFDDERAMYFLCAAAFIAVALLVARMRRTRIGRLLIAGRDNEATLQSLAVPLVRTKVIGFVIAGAMAGFSGALGVYQTRGVGPEAFLTADGIALFIFTILGGVGSVTGALLGASYAGLTQYFLVNNQVLTQIAAYLPIVLIYTAPGGLVGLTTALRDSLLRIIAQRRQIIVPSLFKDYDAEVISRRLVPMAAPSLTSGLAALSGGTRWTSQTVLHGEAARGERTTASERETSVLAASADAAGDDERLLSPVGGPA
jgi:branched-chain amino acid transport system permease protein